jgi:hypothetical protein
MDAINKDSIADFIANAGDVLSEQDLNSLPRWLLIPDCMVLMHFVDGLNHFEYERLVEYLEAYGDDEG